MGSSKLALASRVTLEVRSLCLRIKEGNPSGRDKFSHIDTLFRPNISATRENF